MEKENEKKVMISIDHLYKAYGKKEVLLGLNLEIYEGELFMLFSAQAAFPASA